MKANKNFREILDLLNEAGWGVWSISVIDGYSDARYDLTIARLDPSETGDNPVPDKQQE